MARERRPLPEWIAPQLATLAPAAPEGEDWLHEIKYDGYRLLVWLEGGGVRLMTRNRKDWTDRFPAVVAELAGLRLEGTILDGEVGVEVEGGLTSFQALQNVLSSRSSGRLQFWVFDALFVKGEDLRSRPLLERKARLETLLAGGGRVVRYSGHVQGRGPVFFEQACRHHLEGIIAKRAGAPYRSGRNTDWLKVKCVRQQEFVIGGFTEPGGSRQGLGALHVGTFDEEGRLVYRGKVRTGFSDATLRQLRRRLGGLKRRESPFVDPPRGAAARTSTWVDPVLVAHIRYTEITSDGRIRHPAFMRLREDKPATEVRLEVPAAASPRSTPTTAPSEPAGRSRRAVPARTSKVTAASQARTSGRVRHGAPAEVEGVRMTNPDKVLYSGHGLTKADLAAYYRTVAPWMLPHITGRPLTLVRCPSGYDAHCFFQKHFDAESVPDPLRLVEIEEKDGPALYGVLRDAAGLISLVQLGALELHTWNSRADRLERPDRFVIDLDPDPGVAWPAVVDAALHVRELLAELGLESFVKTTGGKGLHVVVPLARRADWDEVRAFSQAVASLLVRAAPELYTLELSKKKRRGRILLDYLRNARGSTAIEAYSTRARSGAPVAAPIHWDELLDGVRADSFNVQNMPARMARLGADPWQEIGSVKQTLTAAMKRRLGL